MIINGSFITWKDPKKDLPTINCQKVLISVDGEVIEGSYVAGGRFFADAFDDINGYQTTRVHPQAWAEWPKFTGTFDE